MLFKILLDGPQHVTPHSFQFHVSDPYSLPETWCCVKHAKLQLRYPSMHFNFLCIDWIDSSEHVAQNFTLNSSYATTYNIWIILRLESGLQCVAALVSLIHKINISCNVRHVSFFLPSSVLQEHTIGFISTVANFRGS